MSPRFQNNGLTLLDTTTPVAVKLTFKMALLLLLLFVFSTG